MNKLSAPLVPLLFALTCGVVDSACSGAALDAFTRLEASGGTNHGGSGGSPTSGGTFGGTASGGSGSSVTGGGTSTGGTSSATGGTSTGGTNPTGGTSSPTGGTSTGGTNPTGGTSSPTGGTSTGGTNPTGGTSSPTGGTSTGGTNPTGPLLLDDFEDGNNQTIIPEGWWYTAGDQAGSSQREFGAEPPPGEAGTRALRATGRGYQDWFFIGLDLPGQPNMDASGYATLSFEARAQADSVVRNLSIHLLDGTTINPSDAAAVHFATEIVLTASFQTYRLPLKDFVPTTGDNSRRVNQASLATVEFWVFSPESFDIWLDDVAFTQ